MEEAFMEVALAAAFTAAAGMAAVGGGWHGGWGRPGWGGGGLGMAARWLGSWLGRRLLELRLGLGRRLGLGSGLGACGDGRARWGRDRFAACLWRRPGVLGQAARLDGGRPLSWPTAREHLHVNLDLAAERLVGRANSR